MRHNEMLKIICSMVFALVITLISSRSIFMANTPRINKSFIVKVIALPGVIIHNTGQFIASINFNKKIPTSTVKKLQELPVSAMKKVSRETYAYYDTNNKIIYFRTTDYSNYEERTVTVNGEQVRIRFPKGTFK